MSKETEEAKTIFASTIRQLDEVASNFERLNDRLRSRISGFCPTLMPPEEVARKTPEKAPVSPSAYLEEVVNRLIAESRRFHDLEKIVEEIF